MVRPSPVVPPVTTATLPGTPGGIGCSFGSGSASAGPDGRAGRDSHSSSPPSPKKGVGMGVQRTAGIGVGQVEWGFGDAKARSREAAKAGRKEFVGFPGGSALQPTREATPRLFFPLRA